MSQSFQKIGSSIHIDKRLYEQDIAASIVHTQMLIKQKIVKKEDGNKILNGLKKIKVQIKNISHKQKYSLQLVNSKDGHPVRSGNKSWRFEVREGDCGEDKKYSDCKSNRQRTELQTVEYQKRNKEYWYSASIYLVIYLCTTRRKTPQRELTY